MTDNKGIMRQIKDKIMTNPAGMPDVSGIFYPSAQPLTFA
jgi:hypothetical protein